MKNPRKRSSDPTSSLMRWVAAPDDLELSAEAREIVDTQFDAPAVTFQIAQLAMRHREISQFPILDKIEGELYQELFSEQRRVGASTGELVQMGKLLHDRKMSLIEMASEGGISEKPRIEIRMTDDYSSEADAAQFTPKQRERMRRALVALSQPAAKK